MNNKIYDLYFKVCGGVGGTSGGGGGGGRLAVYYKSYEWWEGQLQAYGGSAAYGIGGAGTIYLEVRVRTVESTVSSAIGMFSQ